MKKHLLLLSLGVACLTVSAQEYLGDVPYLPDAYAQKIGKDGRIVAGEITGGDYFTYNTATGQGNSYSECHGGMGNCISSNGWVVASDKKTSKGVILYDGSIVQIPSLAKYAESYLYGITWDGSRIVGLVANPALQNGDFTDADFADAMYLPVYMDVDDNGEIGEPVVLPHPEVDFFGAAPQYCSAVWISDDGKTIAGQVVNNTGQYPYPIIYTQGEDGTWSYSFPSEGLFNPNDLPVLSYPKFDYPVYEVTDFMTPEAAEEFEKDYENWNGDEADNPYNLLFLYMTPEKLAEYNEWLKGYIQYSEYYENVTLVEFYNAMIPVIQDSVFFQQGQMALDSTGRYLATPQAIAYVSSNSLFPVEYYIPYLFDLESGTVKKLGNDFSSLNTNQILPDGTLVCATPVPGAYSPDRTPVHTYVWLPDGEGFITVADWIKSLNPAYGEWMEEYLYHEVPIGYEEDGVTMIYKSMYVTGLVSISDDRETIVGGVDTWAWNNSDGMEMTYILKNVTAGVESIAGETGFDGKYNVYNLQGVKILETTEGNAVNNLPKGLYIINGKKVAVTR